jgi:integrase
VSVEKAPIRLRAKRSEYQNLTERLIDAAAPRQWEYFIRDTKIRGFYVRIKPSGFCSYGVQGRIGGKGNPRQRILGDRSRYSLQEARVKAKEWLRMMSEGCDPKELGIKQPSPRDLLEQYLSLKDLAPRTVESYRYNFDHYLASLQHISVDELTDDLIVDWYQRGKRNPIGTERTFVTLKTVLDFGKTIGRVEHNPAEVVAKVVGRPKSSRNTSHLRYVFLSIKPFMTAFVGSPISDVMRDWMVLVLTTGLRRTESMTLRWEQVNFEEKVIVIPNNKSMRYLVIPMIALTYNMLQQRYLKRDQDSDYVFSNLRNLGPINDARKAIQRVCRDAGIDPLSTHDFRRLFASVCHQLNYSRDEISGLLNHATSNVTDLYVNRSIERLRKMYQSVVDYLDMEVEFAEPDPDDKVSSMVDCATGVMRYNFYKVGGIDHYLTSKAEKERKQYYEDTYWEG